ncbi:Phospholipid phosphatase-related protein type 2 [Camelus dromedarius]|uniref:Phospholipid phosphatase-related protein type 2 n=1 Tax=Camelus dromedarius TaxID=9838 RepID=A0A5N4CJE0_CAMDR|nr:Phospholipid phosphatase-related protein type 2 [Camelus dromedarius]
MIRWASQASGISYDAHPTCHTAEQATGWGTGLRVPTLTCLGLHFHICAMGVTIPALLATRSGCPAFTMAGGRPQLKRSFSIIPCFVFVESVLLGIVVLLAYRLEFTDTFPVHTQGFFCYDSTYAKPYPGPEAASRVPPALVYALVTAGPTLTILLGELARAFFPTPPSAIPIIGESTIVSGACCRFSPPLRRLVRFLGVYSFGLFTTTIFANAGQVVTGNPTPHFLSVCRPNYTALGCLPPSPDRPGPDRFVTDQGACAGSPSLVAAARRAFPCKDAALCAYAVTYTAMYVTLVFRVKGSRLVKPSLCLALLCPAFLVGVVRVAEYRNHWSDVLAGFLTGAAIATFLEPEACRPHSTPARLTPSSGGGGRGRKLLLPTPLLRDLYTLSGLYPSPFHRDNFSPYLFASRDHLLCYHCGQGKKQDFSTVDSAHQPTQLALSMVLMLSTS